MKKKSTFLIKIAVGLTILIGVLLILVTNEKSFKKIFDDDIENISKLSSSIIYAEIDNSLTKPIFVGQTMANDLFLKQWLIDEPAAGAAPAQEEVIRQYLLEYSKKYGYDSVFAVSAKSNFYYTQQGINKVVSTKDTHDVWYYDFIKSEKPYDLDVDQDEVNNDQLTVFVNCRINGADGELMGVVGVGVKMSNLQMLLERYETEYDLKMFLMNADGVVQVDSLLENIEKKNFFDRPSTLDLKNQIIESKTDMKIFWYPEGGFDHCLITKYVDNLEWYLVVQKDTLRTQQMLTAQINRDLLLIAVIIILVLMIISIIIGKYNRMLLRTASIDDVTSLPNIKMFQEIFAQNSKRPACREGILFLFDIDHFKNVNDRFGHMFGNTVLYKISQTAREMVGNKGLVARWGGDEFVGVLYCEKEEAKALLEKFVFAISTMDGIGDVTVSLGATGISASNNLDFLVREADVALYRSKERGRNCVTFFQ